MADIVDSISVFGEPGTDFMNYCHDLDIEVYYCVTGGGENFDTPQHRKETTNKYLRLCRKYGFDGIDMDYEHLNPNLVDAYTKFLNELSLALHKDSRKLAICVGFYPAMYQRPVTPPAPTDPTSCGVTRATTRTSTWWTNDSSTP